MRLWMPLYVADYLADTGHLSTVEHGAYLLLIMHYWQNGGLPDDERKLARIARMTASEWGEVSETLADLFGDAWTHARIDEEIAKAEELLSKRSAAGKAGASARYSKRSGKRKAKPKQTDSHTHTQSQTLSSDSKESSEDISSADKFDEWYSIYPRHEGRGQALKAYRAALKKTDAQALLAGAHTAAERYADTEGKFIPMPASWLNGERWLDHPPRDGPASQARRQAMEDEVDAMVLKAAREADKRNGNQLRADPDGRAEPAGRAFRSAASEGDERPAKPALHGGGAGLP